MVPDWRELAKIVMGHYDYRSAVGLLLPFTQPPSTQVFMLVLGTDAWMYRAFGLIVQTEEPVTEGNYISWGQHTSAKPSGFCCSSLMSSVWTA